ncbi:hypothetical protein H072_11559 [Dactylellina haptotyla CBS 200.50]|uniref:Uncharacterized protein n=1 Tax=Dactylellina haptotyla (strain CBS 200.50) TaxID=1284197 RepID=S7ZWP8_DACHA|nr:hypothetical protein H072_11559 [Dactylellina haptotyla CBS 200.50]
MPDTNQDVKDGTKEPDSVYNDQLSQLPQTSENIDEAIKRIKMMATERIRKKAAADRASLAAAKSADAFSMENASGVDINSLVALTSELNLGTDTVGAKAGVDIHTATIAAKSAHKDTAEPSEPQLAEEIDLISFSDDKPTGLKDGDKKYNGLKLENTNSTESNPEQPKPGTIVVPKPKPKVTIQKLPQTEDGFTPQPWVKRRYTISQLLLLGEVLPYIICPRDRFNVHTFSYDLVHIPGLGNESTGNLLVDHQILTLNLRTELIAFQFFTTYGYRYLERFKDPNHTLYVKGLWVEVRGSAGLRDHGGYRNAYRPTPYDTCVKLGLVREDQEAEILAAEQRNHTHQYSNNGHGGYRGRGNRGGRGSYRGNSYRGGHGNHFIAASSQQPLWKENMNVPLPTISFNSHSGQPASIVGNNVAEAIASEAGTLRGFSKSYAEIQVARTQIDQFAAMLGNGPANSEFGCVIEEAKENLGEKKAEVTNKWGDVYGYTVQEQNVERIKKPKGLAGATTTQEQQMQYIQYMLQTPLAPVLDTTHVSGSLTPSLQLAQRTPPGLHEDMNLDNK